MFADIVLILVALTAATWLLSRLGRGPASVDTPTPPAAPTPPPPPASSGAAGRAPTGPTPTVAPPAAPGPAERALDPWHDGDAAFVDGYIIGRYVERSRAEDDRAAASDDRAGAGDDGLGFGDALDDEHGLGDDHHDGYGYAAFGRAADLAGDLDAAGTDPDDPDAQDGSDWDGSGDGHDGGFSGGFDDGFDEDW